MRRVAEGPTEHDRQHGTDEGVAAGGEIVREDFEERARDDDHRSRVERARLEWDVLEIGAAIAGGKETQPFRLGGDVVGALHIPAGPGFAPQHRIVGEDVEPGHQIGRGDRRAGGRRGVSEGKRRLRDDRRCGGERDHEYRDETQIHGGSGNGRSGLARTRNLSVVTEPR